MTKKSNDTKGLLGAAAILGGVFLLSSGFGSGQQPTPQSNGNGGDTGTTPPPQPSGNKAGTFKPYILYPEYLNRYSYVNLIKYNPHIDGVSSNLSKACAVTFDITGDSGLYAVGFSIRSISPSSQYHDLPLYIGQFEQGDTIEIECPLDLNYILSYSDWGGLASLKYPYVEVAIGLWDILEIPSDAVQVGGNWFFTNSKLTKQLAWATSTQLTKNYGQFAYQPQLNSPGD